jgi:hypothetical protein
MQLKVRAFPNIQVANLFNPVSFNSTSSPHVCSRRSVHYQGLVHFPAGDAGLRPPHLLHYIRFSSLADLWVNPVWKLRVLR